MDKIILYRKLDIDTPEEFKYYENVAALMEEDDYIEENLIVDLIREVNRESLAENVDSYFEHFLENLPDDETELYILVDSVKRMMSGMIGDDMLPEDIVALASEIARFRKWYVHDLNVYDRISGEELSVRDARYNYLAAGFLGERTDFDFRTALDYSIEGYDMRISEIAGLGD